ncbi:MAG TPA: DUF3341 domain-containing protein [Pirellulales bacterium]|jgi:hypothetical protein|nr:DUF3341 domain-containing protein [Pirellulales bacterium]
MTQPSKIYGLVAEFEQADELVDAARAARQAGYRRLDAYTPFHVEELDEALEFHHTRIPLVVLIGGIVGGLTGFFMQYYAMAISYPINVGGRPFNSWPMFIPITFELTILFAALSAVFGMFALNGLPQPYHPLFHLSQFARATRDRFFLCIESTDPLFDAARTLEFLTACQPSEIMEVPL